MDNYPSDNQQPPPEHPLPESHNGYPVGNAAVQHAQEPNPQPGHHGFWPSSGPSHDPIRPTPPVNDMTRPPVPPQGNDIVPQPVVQVLSPRGVEYVFLTIVLFTGAISMISALLLLVNGQAGFSALAFPTSTLLVTVPLFAWLFLRLKRAEFNNPSLALDASKRRSTQLTQIVAFITCLFTVIGLIFAIFSKMSGNYNGSMVKLFLDILVILVVAGGILAYYWMDEHRSR